MPGWSNSDNKFGLSPWIVGPVLGDGVNYNSVQAAINDAAAVGGGTVYIRPSVYTENLTLLANVNLIGATVTGFVGTVRIDGDHTLTNGVVWAKSIYFNGATNAFSVGDPGGVNPATLFLDSCYVTAPNDGVLDATNGVAASFIVFDTNIISGSFCIECQDRLNFSVVKSYLTSTAAGAIFVGGGVTNSGNIDNSSVRGAASAAVDIQTNTTNITAKNCYFEAPNQVINFNGTGTFNSEQNIYKSLNGVPQYIVGPGTYNYAGDVIDPIGSAGIDPAATQTKLGWRPWAESGASSVLSVVRGTAAFDSAQFVVTDGWVQLSGSAGMTWVNQPVSTTVLSGQGNFITGAGVTLTLPGAPAQGDVVAFKDPSGNAPYVIQANAGQILVVGNQVSGLGGTATSSQRGDSMELTFYATGNIWCANSVVGNWNIV